jgi:hypothetical protein
VGVKRDLPLGKKYLELSAAQGFEKAAALTTEIRRCVACGEFVVHHLLCSRCHNMRYCDRRCQLEHCVKLHCVMRRESAGAGGSSSESADPSDDND